MHATVLNHNAKVKAKQADTLYVVAHARQIERGGLVL